MLNKTKKQYYMAGAALTLGMLSPGSAQAQGDTGFSEVSGNILTSIQSIPNLISGLAYLLGTLLAVLGILKLKDHVENPQQTPLKEGAIRLGAGGALFALPFMTDIMLETIGDEGGGVTPGQLNAVTFTNP